MDGRTLAAADVAVAVVAVGLFPDDDNNTHPGPDFCSSCPFSVCFFFFLSYLASLVPPSPKRLRCGYQGTQKKKTALRSILTEVAALQGQDRGCVCISCCHLYPHFSKTSLRLHNIHVVSHVGCCRGRLVISYLARSGRCNESESVEKKKELFHFVPFERRRSARPQLSLSSSWPVLLPEETKRAFHGVYVVHIGPTDGRTDVVVFAKAEEEEETAIA